MTPPLGGGHPHDPAQKSALIAESDARCPATFDAFDGRRCELEEGHADLHWNGMAMWGEYERALETEVEWNPVPASEEGA